MLCNEIKNNKMEQYKKLSLKRHLFLLYCRKMGTEDYGGDVAKHHSFCRFSSAYHGAMWQRYLKYHGKDTTRRVKRSVCIVSLPLLSNGRRTTAGNVRGPIFFLFFHVFSIAHRLTQYLEKNKGDEGTILLDSTRHNVEQHFLHRTTRSIRCKRDLDK